MTVAPDWSVPADPGSWAAARDADFDKVRALLLQITREWSVEGKHEREVSFGRIVDYLENVLFKNLSIEEKSSVEILVPGSGLGRLILEIILKGYKCQGNEISFHMLLASNFFLNKFAMKNQTAVYPFIHKFSNKSSRKAQLAAASIPEICPVEELISLKEKYPSIDIENLMSISTGSFVDVYGPNDGIQPSDFYTGRNTEVRASNKENYNVVVTCFFLDTATNIIDYLLTIHSALKNKGTWINFGPLLWHFEDDEGQLAVSSENVPLKGLELSRADLIDLIKSMGFSIDVHESNIKTTYGGAPGSLGQWVYDCDFFVATKL